MLLIEKDLFGVPAEDFGLQNSCFVYTQVGPYEIRFVFLDSMFTVFYCTMSSNTFSNIKLQYTIALAYKLY